jgi:hypothetical protein
MTVPAFSADSHSAAADALIIQIYTEIEARRKAMTAGTPGLLDFPQAARALQHCAGMAGLSPPVPTTEAEGLARAFLDGDDQPFADCTGHHSVSPELASAFGAGDVLVLSTLLAAREQWSRGPGIVEPPVSEGDAQEALCPVCGSLARLELLLGQYSEKYAVCPACDSLWRIPRVGCPHCGESDGRRLVVYRDESRSDRALVHCLSCRRVWRRLNVKGRMTPPDDLFLRAFESWSEETLLAERDDVQSVPLRPRRGAAAPR